MKKIIGACIASVFCFACSSVENSESSIVSLGKISNSLAQNIKDLTAEQDTTSNIDRLFEIDEIISEKSNHIGDSINSFIEGLKSKEIPFLQTANVDKIKIQSVRILSGKYNELDIEATVFALENSAVVGPFVGLRAVKKDGSIIDVGGGIGCNSKLSANETYVFRGKIININNIDSDFDKLLFDEVIKQW